MTEETKADLPVSGIDTQILDLDTIKVKFPSMVNADNDVKDEIITYINSIT